MSHIKVSAAITNEDTESFIRRAADIRVEIHERLGETIQELFELYFRKAKLDPPQSLMKTIHTIMEDPRHVDPSFKMKPNDVLIYLTKKGVLVVDTIIINHALTADSNHVREAIETMIQISHDGHMSVVIPLAKLPCIPELLAPNDKIKSKAFAEFKMQERQEAIDNSLVDSFLPSKIEKARLFASLSEQIVVV